MREVGRDDQERGRKRERREKRHVGALARHVDTSKRAGPRVAPQERVLRVFLAATAIAGVLLPVDVGAQLAVPQGSGLTPQQLAFLNTQRFTSTEQLAALASSLPPGGVAALISTLSPQQLAALTAQLPAISAAITPEQLAVLSGQRSGAAPPLVEQQLAAQAYMQTLYVLELSRQQPLATQDEVERQRAEYFSNGAEAAGVPSAGPGAAFFQNGAELMASPTNSWRQVDPSQGAGAFESMDGGARPFSAQENPGDAGAAAVGIAEGGTPNAATAAEREEAAP